MGRRELSAVVMGLVVSASVVLVEGVLGTGVPVDECASSEAERPEEEQPLHELVRGVSNYGFVMGAPGSENVVYWDHVFDELDAEDPEYRALLDSLSPGVRASYDGVWMVRRNAFKREQERQAAEDERAEAEYAVFIEEHLRRLRGEAPAPVPGPAEADRGWNELYRSVVATPQSMIGGFAASDAAVDEFVARARPVAPEVSEAWKTVMRLKSGAWDVQTCARYQRARFVICAHEQAEGCKAQLERELSDCDECATDGACGSR